MDPYLLYFLNNLVSHYGLSDKVVIFLAEKFYYIFFLAFFVYLFFTKIYSRREKLKILLISFLSAAISRLIFTEAIRFFYHRPRPFIILADITALVEEKSYSFPSGHAAFVFAFAAAIYKYNKKWSAVFFIIGLINGIARIIAGVHYPSDILGGALLGILTGYLGARILTK